MEAGPQPLDMDKVQSAIDLALTNHTKRLEELFNKFQPPVVGLSKKEPEKKQKKKNNRNNKNNKKTAKKKKKSNDDEEGFGVIDEELEKVIESIMKDNDFDENYFDEDDGKTRYISKYDLRCNIPVTTLDFAEL